MANICINTLKVKGDSKQLNHFISKTKDKKSNKELLLENLIPIPSSIVDDEEQIDWKNEVWGTTYTCDCKYETISETEVIIHFFSKWSPPIGWVQIVAKLYGRLSFSLRYKEEEIGFHGSFHAKGPNTRDYRSVSFGYPVDGYKSNPFIGK